LAPRVFLEYLAVFSRILAKSRGNGAVSGRRVRQKRIERNEEKKR